MKIAVSSTGKDPNSDVSEVFGRCPYFVIAEVEDRKIVRTETIENVSAKQVGGTGIVAAQATVERGANIIITGNIGPRALDVFRQFGIEIYKGKGSIKEVLQEFIDGKLEKIG